MMMTLFVTLTVIMQGAVGQPQAEAVFINDNLSECKS